ncbi:MAG: sigma-70 family RNA polymerase sigma factor [Acidobacteriia bacterium]|nr:sigma-70 family RNA polymerase sigma factor [Terriglobia bacterium]
MAPQTAPNPVSSAQIEQEVLRIYHEHAAKLSRYAASFAQSQDGARDAVQEVFLRYCIERQYGREIENPRAWLYFVMRNYLLDRHRTVTRREVIAENLDHMPGSQQDPEAVLHRSEMARDLAALLTEREFACLRLRAEGMDYAEIASALGIQIGTVGALLSRAQKKIRHSAEYDESTPLGTAEAIHSLFDKREAYS